MWYNKVVADLSNIPSFIDYYENQLINAKTSSPATPGRTADPVAERLVE